MAGKRLVQGPKSSGTKRRTPGTAGRTAKSNPASPNPGQSEWVPAEDSRTGLSVGTLRRAIIDNLFYTQGKFPGIADQNDYYLALAYTVRDRLLERWINTAETYRTQDCRMVCYLSAEFLPGPRLESNLLHLGIERQVRQALAELGLDLQGLIEQEAEPGLGSGGLGRLAACFLDSLATLQIPAIGYGIRYEIGIFEQAIREGWQVELTDKWLQLGNPWEIGHPTDAVEVKFGGHTEPFTDEHGRYQVRWVPNHVIKGVPYDTPILGYRNKTANTLRLWGAEATESFDFARFNVGDYFGAVHEKMASETISKVLYPNDDQAQGKFLRLEQQFFFVSCSLQDILRMHLKQGRRLEDFDKKWAIQLNDTHPSIAVAELMRLLVDEHGMDWEPARRITRNTLGYTNHTLLPEALERWPLPLFESLLPRHLEIIYEINQRFLGEVRARFPGDEARVRRMSLIDEDGPKYIRMAHLATVGSHAVNGVAKLHTELLKRNVLADFYQMYPKKFSNKTNGVTPRRWLLLCNPRLAKLVTDRIGHEWTTELDELRKLETLADNAGFREDWRRVKEANKRALALYIQQKTGINVDPRSLFDIQAKRFHEYKRQHLNVLHIITLYNRIKRNPGIDITPRTFVFAGKAAPGYAMAKLIIKLIHSVAEVVNKDPDVAGRLKVVFLPDFSVCLGQRIYPAADLSEQISTAGKEASGTGNMKFALNGALTIGTLDGANIEIREEVGAENFFLFGLTAEQASALRASGYNPRNYYNSVPELSEVLNQLGSGQFSGGDRGLFRPLVDSLLDRDEYLLLADYKSYVDCQDRVSQAFRDPERWTRKSILNTAHMGRFSSDRAIREYSQEIWHAVQVEAVARP
jgi:starch phosphorylase